jgi:hypothetical protein
MMYERTSGIGDRPVPSGATIGQGGAISLSPSGVIQCPSRKPFTVHRTGATSFRRRRSVRGPQMVGCSARPVTTPLSCIGNSRKGKAPVRHALTSA